jgi:hypothetical protein
MCMMVSPKWPAPLFSGKLRKILDRSVTPDPSKDTNRQTEIPEETTPQTSSSIPHHPSTRLQEHHPSLTETNSYAAFSHALRHEFNDLFFFACNQTVSGENVLFLRLVQCWKACWSLISLDTDSNICTKRVDAECPLRRKIFSVAVEMYYDFVNPSTACKVPLNLEYGLAATLDTVFGDAAMSIPTSVQHERTVVAPFTVLDREDSMVGYHDLLGLWWDRASSTDETTNNEDHLHEKPLPALPANTTTPDSFRLLKMNSRVSKTAAIPESFCKDVFDYVESSVHFMVLRDTFPKYISWCKLKDIESASSIKAGGKLLKKKGG